MRKAIVFLLFFLSGVFICTSIFAHVWAIRDITRVYYGSGSDEPVPADYSGNLITDVAIFRAYYGLWSVRGVTRIYFGGTGDYPVPADYDGDLSDNVGVFRASASGMWAIRGITRAYYGQSGDTPVSNLGYGDYDGDGTSDIAIYRSSSGLWAIRNLTRVYFGASCAPASGDYNGDGVTDIGIFKDSSGVWAIRNLTRVYFGGSSDLPIPGDYDGDGTFDVGLFRASSGLWAIRGISRAYFGSSGDSPVPGDYDGDGSRDIAVFRTLAPTPVPATPIYQIQHDGVTGTVTVTGIVSLVYPNMEFFIADASGPYNGICIQQSTYGPEIGNSVTLTGTVYDANGQTQIKSLSNYTVNSEGNTPYSAVTVTTGQLAQDQYEGCLVKIENVTVNNEDAGSGKWTVNNGEGTVTIDDELDYNYFPFNGDQFNSIAGIVERSGTSYWLQPRFTTDFDAPNDVLPHYALYGDVVTMDDSHNVYDNYYVEVKGDSIEGVTATAPGGVDIISVAGLIFPGLISTHDHASYDLWDFIPFTECPNFVDRNEWAATQMYCDFKSQRDGFSGYYDEIAKLMQVRMASSGCTVTQGQVSSFNHGQDNVAKLGVGIINGERFPGRCYDKVVGTTDSDQASVWAEKHQDGVNGKLHRYIIHLAETTDKPGNDMAYQWNWWKSHDGFDGHDTIIHGVNIPQNEWSLFNTHPDGYKTVLSWACKSNMLLYDTTANVRDALDAGVTVALAPDWTESGMPNMLAEINYCKYVADDYGWNIQTREYIDMVTRNAAAGFSQEERMGTIEEGKLASFMVIDDGDGDPYDDLMVVAGGGSDPDYRCGPKDVKLTIVAGRPVYGDSALLNTTNFPFIYHGYIEDLTICGLPKKLNFARYDSGSYGGVNDLFMDYYLAMWEKYCYSEKYPCDFLSYDPAGVLPPTPVPTATPPPGTYPIKSGLDDAHMHESTYSDTAGYVHIGWRSDSIGSYYSGFRYTDVDIPQGATINSASLVVTYQNDNYNNNVSLKIAAEDTDDSAADWDPGPNPKPAFFGRTPTTARVDWDLTSPWTEEHDYTSPDISSLIQEVVNRTGWSSGNALSIMIYSDDSGGEKKRRIYSYDGAPAKSARLEVDFVSITPTPTPVGFHTPSPPPTMTPTPTVIPTPTVSPTPEGYKTPLPTPTPDTSNLLVNSGFEAWTSSTQPENWTDGSYGDATYQQESGTVHGGTYSIKVTTTTDPGIYGDGFYQDANITVGESYTFSAWLWSEQTGDMGITASWYDGANPHYWDTVTTTDAGKWTQWSIQSTAPAGTVNVRCWIRGFANSAACGYADDADFRLTP